MGRQTFAVCFSTSPRVTRDPERKVHHLSATPEEYAHNVALAVEILRRKEIDKWLLARAVLGSVSIPRPGVDRPTLPPARAICTIYFNAHHRRTSLRGRESELLARRHGNQIECHTARGHIALPPNVAPTTTRTGCSAVRRTCTNTACSSTTSSPRSRFLRRHHRRRRTLDRDAAHGRAPGYRVARHRTRRRPPTRSKCFGS